MILRYFTTLTYPSSFANRAQVMKMSEAFSAKLDYRLFVLEMKDDIQNIFSSYGVRREFPLTSIDVKRAKPRALRAAIAFRRIVQASPKDTIFYMREGMPAFFLLLISSRFRKNFFYEAHSFARHSRFIYKVIFRFAKGIITTTESKAEVFEKEFGVPKSKLLVGRNAIDIRDFQIIPEKNEARTRLGISPERYVIVFVGKPTVDRGIDLILKLAEAIHQEADVVLVGGTAGEIEKFKTHPGFAHTTFVGHVPHDQAVLYMVAADVLICPNSATFPDLSQHGSPLKALEYLASGTPTIFSDLPMLQEIGRDEKVLFAKSDDLQDWMQKIRYVFAHVDEMRVMAEKSRKFALACHWDARAENIIAFMHKKLND